MIIHLTKKQIRQECVEFRKTLSPEFITQASSQIIEKITTIQVYNTAQHIAWYLPTQGEVDLSFLWETAIQTGKSCYFPAIQADRTLRFLPYTTHTKLCPNRYGILEPALTLDQAIDSRCIDLIFMPVVAFDASLTRLGMGGGFYDRTLSLYPIPCLGVAYEWQRYPILPADPWDVKPDLIVTETTIYTP
ncbi:MAG: 5-formyltetrahydrofolate cyclo-ligase [Legionella sp.]|nr:MAG: 5-formyltetrahydrofolate cyclo-ligase [Legionella sp.]